MAKVTALSPAPPAASSASSGSSDPSGATTSLGGASNALAAFDLPSMPGPYEDLNLVNSPEFSKLFGLRSDSTPTLASMLPSSSLTGLLSPGATGLTPTAGFSWRTSAPPTPKNPDAHEDTVMMQATASGSGTVGQTPGKTPQGASDHLGGFAPSHAPSEPQTTSIPTSQTFGSGSAFNMQPPVAPFTPPTGGNLFGFDHANAGPSAIRMNPHPQQMMPFGQGAPPQPPGLFNANETNFLSNFLSNFDGWDFNPSLPMQMPSFAEAEKNAFQFGIPTPPQQMPGGYFDGRRAPRRSGSGASTVGGRSKASPRGPYGSGGMLPSPSHRMDASASAAFGRPMEDFDDNDEDNEDTDHAMSDGQRLQGGTGTGKKMKTEHAGNGGMASRVRNQHTSQSMRGQQSIDGTGGGAVPEAEKRQNHILSEQRRRGHIREAFKELVDMLEAGREFGARGLGLSSGAGTGIEDEGLDDRSDYESTLEEEGPNAAAKRRKAKTKRRAALEAARKASASGQAVSAALVNGGGGRGKGRGRGGSAGGGAGSKSAVLFQAVDLLHWLDGRNKSLAQHVEDLEGVLVMQPAA